MICSSFARIKSLVALHPEGVDRNLDTYERPADPEASPSTRRAWIEIWRLIRLDPRRVSPSTRRAWIEIAGSIPSVPALTGRPPPGGRG